MQSFTNYSLNLRNVFPQRFATRAIAAGVDLPTLSAILDHTSVQMTIRYVRSAEGQKRFAAGKLESFRTAGMWKAMEKSRQVCTVSATVQ